MAWNGPTSGLTHRWPMDDANVVGTSIKDVVGTLHGTATAAIVSDTGPISGSTARKNTSPTVITLPSSPITIGSDFTLAAWWFVNDIHASSSDATDPCFFGLNDGTNALRFGNSFDQTSGGLQFVARANAFDRTTEAHLVSATWAHVCATVSGSTLTTYVNGVATTTAIVNGGSLGSDNCFFGRDTSGGRLCPAGDKMYQIVTYSRALSSTEVGQLFNAESVTDKGFSASQGTYSISGKTVSFLRQRILNASQGTYLVSGKSIDFAKKGQFLLNSGTYSVVGEPVDVSRPSTWPGPSSGLTHRWPMDDDNVSGTTLIDVVAGLNGTMTANVVSAAGNLPGTTARQNLTPTFVSLSSSPIDLSGSYSLGGWTFVPDITALSNDFTDPAFCGFFDGSRAIRAGNAVDTSSGGIIGSFYYIDNSSDFYSVNQPFVSGEWLHWCVTVNGSTHTLYINGSPVSQGSPTGSAVGTANGFFGRDASGRLCPTGTRLRQWVTYNRALTSFEVLQLFNADSGATTEIDFPVSPGGYTVTGEAISFLRKRVTSVAQGVYSLLGGAVSILKNKVLMAGQGSYTVSGKNATFLRSRVLQASSGTYHLVGGAVSLTSNVETDLSFGTYIVQGSSINFFRRHILSASSGTYHLNGQSAGILRHKFIALSGGFYNLAGQVATLKTDKGFFVLGSGSYTLQGSDLAVISKKFFPLATGVYSITPGVADIRKAEVIPNEPGSEIPTLYTRQKPVVGTWTPQGVGHDGWTSQVKLKKDWTHE